MEPLRLRTSDKPRGRRKPPRSAALFSIPEALRRADDTIRDGPCRGHLPRVNGRGQLIQRFVLPLELCSPQNRMRHERAWAHAAHKEKVFRMMWIQHSLVRAEHLPTSSRALIRAVRFSVKEPDQLSDGFKIPIDILCRPKPPNAEGKRGKKGLNFLFDDAPAYVEIATWWEYAAPGKGFGLLEIWDGRSV